MQFLPERESAYREHMFARERPRLRMFVMIPAPMLLLFALSAKRIVKSNGFSGIK